MKTILLLTFCCNLLLAQGIKITQMYYYNDPEGISLHRPSMDHSETLIMGEHNPKSKEGIFDFKELVFYLHGDTSKNQKYIRHPKVSKKKRTSSKKTTPFFSGYGQWSPSYDSLFTYIRVIDDKWVGRRFDLISTRISGIRSKNKKILKKIDRTINQEEMSFSPNFIKYYTLFSGGKNQDDIYYVIYLNENGREEVISNDEIFKLNNHKIFPIYLQEIDTLYIFNPLLKDPVDIQINHANAIYPYPDILMTIIGGLKTEKDIYYFCTIDDVSDGTAVPIIKGSPIYNQFDARFSHDGKYISYINQNRQEFFELKVVETPQHTRIADCIIKEGSDNNSFYQAEHYTIDNILTYEDLGLDAFRYYAYDWHPQYNIIFYIVNDGNDDIIKYYDVDRQKGGMVTTNTSANRYISVSPKGNHLVFTFTGHSEETYHFMNCSYRNRVNNLNCCGNKTTGHNIGVAKLEIQ